ILNQGNQSSPAFATKFSYSNTPSTTGNLTDSGSSCSSGSLGVGSSTTCSVLVNVPQSLASGAWYLVATTDSNGAVVEQDESNNSRLADSGAITIVGSSISLSSSTLNFGTSSGLTTGSQTVSISFNGPALAWTAISNQPNISVFPPSGTGFATLQITAAPGPS